MSPDAGGAVAGGGGASAGFCAHRCASRWAWQGNVDNGLTKARGAARKMQLFCATQPEAQLQRTLPASADAYILTAWRRAWNRWSHWS